MGLLGCCTPTLLTSLNGIIGVLHPKTPHQSEWDYWGTAPQISSPVSMGLLGCCTPKLLTSLNGIIGVLHPKPPHQSQWDYWGAAPQISSPVSMGLLWCCTPKLLTSLPMGLLGCCTPTLLTSLNGIIGVLHPNPPHQSEWDYWGAAPQNSSPV